MKFFTLISLTLTSLLAQERSFFIQHSNDLIFGVDRDYSTGTQIGINWGDNSYAIVQDIYTPDNKYQPTPPQGEHPYAGWLAFKMQHRYTLYDQPSSLTLSLGTTGERAKAQEVQKMFHQLIHNDTIVGWDSQHPNQYGYILEFYNSYTTPLVTPFSHLALGGISRYWEVGIGKEMEGRLLKRDVQLSTTLAGRYVDKNIFLEADSNGYRVEKKDLMATFEIKLATHLGDYHIELSTTLHSREYEGQKLPYGYGTLRVSHPF